jgi:hypothetical protein
MGWTRRAFLGRAAAAAAVPAAAAAGLKVAGSAGSAKAGEPARTGPTTSHKVVAENSLPGDPHWWIKHLAADEKTIGGFTGKASVRPGEKIDLYVSTTAREFRATAFRMGWYRGDLARQVWASKWTRGHKQRAAEFIGATRTVQARWDVSLTVPTDDWPEGAYLFRLDSDQGQRYVPVTVRSASTAGKVVLKQAVPTWQAYNTYGSHDLYQGPGGYDDRSYVVSMDRPISYDGAYLFMVYERKLINLAEKIGIPLGYLTAMDIARDSHSLDGASALVSPGHDEYWSPEERAIVTTARNKGMNIAFLGANAMFRRTRLQDSPIGEYRQVVCYKTSYQLDPMYGVHDDLVTSDWREPPNPDPESSLIGTLYEGFPTLAHYVVEKPDAWMFKGTGVRKGSSFRGLVGVEYDRVTPGYPIERPIEIVAHSPLTCDGVSSYADSAYYTHKSGAGVFNVGTMNWVEAFGQPLYNWGLTQAAVRFTKRVTTNVLLAFADGPAAHKYPAHDNLDAIHEHYGDPLAADATATGGSTGA